MNSLEKYFQDLKEIHSSGAAVEEESYYGAIESLFNEIGKKFKPKVRCILQLGNRGAGKPDGGFFTEDQYKLRGTKKLPREQVPSRGVVEVKPPKDDAWVTADGEQVTRYWGRYRQVLVTNLRDFVFVGQDTEGKAAKLESYRLASSEREFWREISHPRTLAAKHEKRFLEYIKRVLLHAAPISTPKDLAFFLASYARDALARIEGQELEALARLRGTLEQALGLKFVGKKGEHFFRSSLVQTLFYGVFSAWVLWSKQHSPASSRDKFDWAHTARLLRVPVLRKLFHEVADPGQLEELKLDQVLGWAAATLNRVDPANFFLNFQETHAVQYFYEPFLAEFDPELRKEMGVWFTPPEVVQYMVERVDTVLREELDLPDGLADKQVYVLDPGGGTGSFLVAVLQRIHDTLRAKGGNGLLAAELKRAAKERVFAFEILPASFVVAHLQIGLLLQRLGAPLAENERVAVYLSSALTGWEPPEGPKKQLAFKEFEEERDAAEEVKQRAPILVILGNPPYNAFAGVSPEEEGDLVKPYKEGLVKVWNIKKFNLDDLYVRFFRIAERRIGEKSDRGVVCYISNFSYLGDPSFVVMRQRFLSEFQQMWFDCLNGDSRETGKLTPDGKPDPSIFSTEYNREGIRVGTAIALLVRKTKSNEKQDVRFRHFWGVTKRRDLVDSLSRKPFGADYDTAEPEVGNRYSFKPELVNRSYREWPKLSEFCAIPPINGLMEKRGGSLIDMDRLALQTRITSYYDPQVSWTQLYDAVPELTKNAARFDARKARTKVQAAEKFCEKCIRKYALRPFDNRWCYYSGVRPLWNEPRPVLWQQAQQNNLFLMTRPAGVASPEGVPFFFTRCLGDNDFLRGHAYYIPFLVRAGRATPADQKQAHLLHEETTLAPNISAALGAFLDHIGIGGDTRAQLESVRRSVGGGRRRDAF